MKNIALAMLLPTLVFANEIIGTGDVKTNKTVTKEAAANDAVKSEQPESLDESAAETKTTTETNMTNNTDTQTTDNATAFMTENAKQPGIVSLNENLQYKVIEEGQGPQPSMHSSVTVHYEGTLLDGTEFDSSFKRNEPATFNLDQVIQGWTESLPHMKTGATWMVYIGPELAYGAKGIPGVIPPNSVLVFKIKLIKVNS